MTKEEQELYDSDLKAKSDWNAGIEWAEKKAKRSEKMTIARNLKDQGIDEANISKATGLSLEEIKAL